MAQEVVPAEAAGTGPARARNRFSGLDLLAFALLGTGLLAVATRLVPPAGALATGRRILPILIFLGTVIVLAELAARAELFDVIATRLTGWARGRNVALFALCFGFAAATTALLNLDTTAVLLTPVMLAMAARAGVPPLPLAMTTIWLANGASLLLPVSNLTNLLAADRIGLSVGGFAGAMVLPQAAVLVAVGACLWILYWRGNPARYTPPAPVRPRDRRLLLSAAAACTAFLLGVLWGERLELVSAVCALVLAAAYARWDRAALRWSLLPWRLLVLVTGLFLTVEAVGRLGLADLMSAMIGVDPGAVGVVRAAVTSGLLANAVNNLPAYVAGEAVVAAGHRDQLLGLLLGANVAPLVTAWASLATLLWAQRCQAAGVRIGWGRFAVTGAVTGAAALAAGTAVLLLAR
ncbi:SLC13 family permease [Catellatospora chokoriensis]|uniref:Arsenic transporter n=1 Tax=Catellatospora chokoriensis TaxID=310353 RepID=A0A8J3NQ05_9ACTN|nr:SLC13 family permease [Catellatospora chokoriensis]GIF88031.1 arsenic transporter [Catellatospora chokoriensis]